MSYHSTEFHPDGRMPGCFVYMLLCDHAGMIFIKIGLTQQLSVRLMNLRVACPFEPRIFAFTEVANRGRAKHLEMDLLDALVQWHSHGEWFAVAERERAEFNAAWRPVLVRHSDHSRKLEWQQVAVEPLVKEGKRRAAYFRTRYAKAMNTDRRKRPKLRSAHNSAYDE